MSGRGLQEPSSILRPSLQAVKGGLAMPAPHQLVAYWGGVDMMHKAC